MAPHKGPRPVETLAAKWHRLARLAEAQGVRLLREAASGEVFATSAVFEDTVYRLTGTACSCPGYGRWARCKHVALLRRSLGLLPPPDDGEPEPPSPAAPAVLRPQAAARQEDRGDGAGPGDADGRPPAPIVPFTRPARPERDAA